MKRVFEVRRERADVTSDGSLGVRPSHFRESTLGAPSYWIDGEEVTEEEFLRERDIEATREGHEPA